MSIRTSDPGLVSGRHQFIADLPFGGLEVCFVRSPVALGLIRSIDGTPAADEPGVVRVDTAASLDLEPFVHMAHFDKRQCRYPLASGMVRHVGEALAVVTASSFAEAVDASELVDIDIVPLPIDSLLYPESGTNTVTVLDETTVIAGAPDAAITVVNQRVSSTPIECDGIIATLLPDGSLDVWCTGQGVHGLRLELADALHLPIDRIRVRLPFVGGGFGARASLPVEFVVVCRLAQLVGRPVRWLQTRSELLTGQAQGRGITSEVSLKFGDDRIEYLTGSALAEAGATAHMASALLVSVMRQMTGMYRVDQLSWRGSGEMSPTVPVGAYRGAGQPEANHARERLLDVAAQLRGEDPIELRRRLLLRADEFPITQPGGVAYDDANPLLALETAIAAADVADWRVEQTKRRKANDHCEIGIGVACYAQTSGRGRPIDGATITINTDGGALITCASSSHGQSHSDTFRALVSERLGIDASQISFVDADTDALDDGLSTGGSRASQVLATVLVESCAQLVDDARDIAAAKLEVAPTDLVVVTASHGLGPGLAVNGVPTARVVWTELASEHESGCLAVARTGQAAGEAHPFGTHISVVEVDTETGGVTVIAHTAVDDCGVVLQPTFVAGQQHGGAVAGIGQALFEHSAYDADGNAVAGSFASYLLPTANDVPFINAIAQTTPTERNVLGTRGIGENGCNGATGAVHNAVVDALRERGVLHLQLPLAPMTVWEALQTAPLTP